jgi:hypothetical protein
MIDVAFNDMGDRWVQEDGVGRLTFYLAALGVANTSGQVGVKSGKFPIDAKTAAWLTREVYKDYDNVSPIDVGGYHAALHAVFDMSKVLGELAPVTFHSPALGNKVLATRLVDHSFGVGRLV